MAGVRVHVVMPRGLVERIDAALPEGVSRGGFIRAAVEAALPEGESPAMEGAHKLAAAFGVSEAQWEAAKESERPSPRRPSFVKRDVAPIPKGKP